MHVLALVRASSGFVVGLVSAYYWWKASRVTPKPDWVDGIAPVIPELEQLGWNVAFIKQAEKSGAFNSTAAILTAIAVALSTASSVVGLLS